MRYATAQPQAFFTVGYRVPILLATIRDEDGNAENITGLTIAFAMWLEGSETAKVNFVAMSIVSGSAGTCSYSWSSADVNAAGLYVCRIRFGTGASDYELTHPFTIEFKQPYDHVLKRR